MQQESSPRGDPKSSSKNVQEALTGGDQCFGTPGAWGTGRVPGRDLMLPKFVDYPCLALKRPIPSAAALNDKANLAEELIIAQLDADGDCELDPHENTLENTVRSKRRRTEKAPYILRQLFIRGRMQAIVFECFMELCYRGACSFSSLKYPIMWYSLYEPEHPGNYSLWIRRMLCLFNTLNRNWDKDQTGWELDQSVRTISYNAPFMWLSIMIARSFTNLDDVFNIIRQSGILGSVKVDALAVMRRDRQPSPDWKSDHKLLRYETVGAHGTFGWWLPEAVDGQILELPFDRAAEKVMNGFHFQIERTEHCYAGYFDLTVEEMQPPGRPTYPRNIRDQSTDGSYLKTGEAEAGVIGSEATS